MRDILFLVNVLALTWVAIHVPYVPPEEPVPPVEIDWREARPISPAEFERTHVRPASLPPARPVDVIYT